jgi:pimeloyl-ACP methyl ester carboxylesterase
MTIRTARNGGTEIAYETFGPEGGEPLLLIMGLDCQMVWWPEGFCQALVDRGFRVARFDNRDVGLSTRFDSSRARNPFRAVLTGAGGAGAAYTAEDMIDDGIAVMDALGWEAAHVVGISLGARLAIGTAIRHPDRVRAVTSIAGMPLRGLLDMLRYVRFGIFPKLARIGRAYPATDEGAITMLVELTRVLVSPHHPFDEAWAREVAETSHARAPRDPGTTQRQVAAERPARDLYRRLAEISAPTLVLHGADDPLIRPAAAAALARAIPGAEAIVHPDMGHEIPAHLWTPIAAAISALTPDAPVPA